MKDYRDKLVGPGSWLLGGVLRLLGSTYRLDSVIGQEHLSALLDRPHPVVISFWHDRSFFLGYFLHQFVHLQGLDITVLSSLSRDGELVARLARSWKLRLVRGSASRGGQAALRGLHRAIVQHGSSPLTIPDGPRGPRHVAKAGAVILSQLSRAPILPLSYAAHRVWRLRSWDRLLVPRPFTRVVLAVGPLIRVPRHLDDEAREAERRRLESVLNELGDRAEAELARS